MPPEAVVARLNAALHGRYLVERELGQGGMATVYLAEDLRHERRVALKVLKPELAAVVGAARFLVEIRTTANLQHPHILPLFDSGEADGFLFYVMPYVEGESLRAKLDREGQLDVQEAVGLAIKVATALDYAHDRGVIHRDVKPGNILISDRGEPLVADFGIALAVAQAGAGRLTETGLSLGTPRYMPPEQATGDRQVDARSDVYALACVLYEMLAGQPPFTASTTPALLAKILTTDAPLVSTVRRSAPDNVGAALAKALEKLPADRFKNAADFAAALEDPSFTRGDTGGRRVREAQAATSSRPGNARVTAAVIVAVVMAGLAGWGWLGRVPTVNREPVPFRFPLSDAHVVLGGERRLAISADGSLIAISGVVDGQSGIYLRPAGQRELRMIPGTEGAAYPDFSPDGRWLAFMQGGEIRRVDLSGGPILPVAEGRYPSWTLEDTLVFASPEGLAWIDPFGGEPVTIRPGVVANDRPRLLPDGTAVLFQAGGSSLNGRLSMVDVASGVVTDLGISGTNPRYVASGHILFGGPDQVLMAVPFDLAAHRVTGEPSTVLTDVLVLGGGALQFEVSETGTAVYARSQREGPPGYRLAFVDLGGRETLAPLEQAYYQAPRFSPDGRRIAYSAEGRVWVWDRSTGADRVLTPEAMDAGWPVWSSDGRYVYFSAELSDVTDGRDGFRTRADGSGEPELLFRRPGSQLLSDVSPDGTRLVFSEPVGGRTIDILTALLTPDGPEFSDYLSAPWNEGNARISPDGSVAAYASAEPGAAGVYVRTFPEPTGPQRVAERAQDPVWARDGSALYYFSRDTIWRAGVRAGEVDETRPLFGGDWVMFSGATLANFDVHPDGTSFVFVKDPEADSSSAGGPPAPADLEVVVNWFGELRQRLGGS